MHFKAFPKKVRIVEVGPRDGLQNEPQSVSLQAKINFINQLSNSGLISIEVGSFVSPKWVPQMADTAAVLSGIAQHSGVLYPVLVPNVAGLEAALALHAKTIAVFTTPSEQFSTHNTHCSVAESLARIADVCAKAKAAGVKVRGYLSCVLGCPYEGEIAPQKVADLAEKLIVLGCDEISLGDTIGVGTPFKTKALLETVIKKIPVEQLAVHFHDTYGLALVNIYAALEMGVAIIDSAVAGLGGCPYAPGASGNVATEKVLCMLNGMGIQTGVDIQKIAAAGEFICDQLGYVYSHKIYTQKCPARSKSQNESK